MNNHKHIKTNKMELIVINGEWRRDNSISYKVKLCYQEPGQIMKNIDTLDSGETGPLAGDEDSDVVNYFSAIYPGMKIISKVI